MDFYKKFTLYLQKDLQNAVNTAGKYIKNLKALLRESYDRKYHTNTIFQNRKFKVLSEDSDTIALSEEEIQKIYDCDLSNDERLDRVRDTFIVGCWTGLRYSDLSRLTKDNVKGDDIFIAQQKTKEFSPESLVIPITDVVRAIFNKYLEKEGAILPRILTDQKMNAYLKEVGEKAGLTDLVPDKPRKQSKDERTIVPEYLKLTVHTARKSYATNLFLRGNEPIDIMKITGHKTEKEFMRYIKMTKKSAADRIRSSLNISNTK
jgi:integrase